MLLNHLLHIPQKQSCHYGTYSIVCTASKVWNDILRKSNKDLLCCEFFAFKKTIIFSASMKIITEMIELYFVNLQFMVVIKIINFVLFTHIQYLFSILYAVSLYLLLYLFLFHLYIISFFIYFLLFLFIIIIIIIIIKHG